MRIPVMPCDMPCVPARKKNPFFAEYEATELLAGVKRAVLDAIMDEEFVSVEGVRNLQRVPGDDGNWHFEPSRYEDFIIHIVHKPNR